MLKCSTLKTLRKSHVGAVVRRDKAGMSLNGNVLHFNVAETVVLSEVLFAVLSFLFTVLQHHLFVCVLVGDIRKMHRHRKEAYFELLLGFTEKLIDNKNYLFNIGAGKRHKPLRATEGA